MIQGLHLLLCNLLDIFVPWTRKWGSSGPTVVHALGKWLASFAALDVILAAVVIFRCSGYALVSLSINQSIKTRDADRCLHCDGRPSTPVLCSAEQWWRGLARPFCCPCTNYAVFLCDAFHPRSPVVWSSAAYIGDRHGRTMMNCDAWRLTAEAPKVRLGYWPAKRICSFYALWMICQTSFCSICFQKPGFPFADHPVNVQLPHQ